MKKEDEILIKLTQIEDKIDAHLADHQRKFDLITKLVIPATGIVTSAIHFAVAHFMIQPKH